MMLTKQWPCAYRGYSPGQSGLHARVLGDECGDELPQRDGGGERLVGQPRAAERRGVVVEQPAEDLAPLVGLLRVRVTVRGRVRVSVRVRGRGRGRGRARPSDPLGERTRV